MSPFTWSQSALFLNLSNKTRIHISLWYVSLWYFAEDQMPMLPLTRADFLENYISHKASECWSFFGHLIPLLFGSLMGDVVNLATSPWRKHRLGQQLPEGNALLKRETKCWNDLRGRDSLQDGSGMNCFHYLHFKCQNELFWHLLLIKKSFWHFLHIRNYGIFFCCSLTSCFGT